MQSTLVINKCGKALFLNDADCGNGMAVEKYNTFCDTGLPGRQIYFVKCLLADAVMKIFKQGSV